MHREYRLAKREDFNHVYRRGKSVANQQFVLYAMAQPKQEHFRLGVSVSKKIGNAVVRNRIRRMMKEIVRLHIPEIDGGVDFIIIARKPAADLEYAQMEKSIMHVLKRAKLRENGRPGERRAEPRSGE
ncbi:ribonuclease P protein component [Paenibacillus contaminans]|uniref:Ribonuclease P protein component n=1 Tax=Paenibacillus contaminans TaxID=450362 RepID=A0A329MIZ1_9BACL|nr:ribonuclease P protein component [Paenibacillus contaminans]RAV19528.1 ribonuclease P protein component [Paenibacillus contaminans]